MRVKKALVGSLIVFHAGCASSAGDDPDNGQSSSDDGGSAATQEGGNVSTGGDAGNGGGDGNGGGASDGGSQLADAGKGNGHDGGSGGYDAGPPPNLDAGTTFTVAQPISGTPVPTTVPLQGPGLILMGGGTDVDSAFVWMHDTLAGSATTKLGNIVVFNIQGAPPSVDNAYTSYIFALAPFQSVQTLYLGGYKNDGNNAPEATVADIAIAAYYVNQADGVFFAGGDQADYVYWYNTSPALANAVTALYERGGVIGGTSAGCAIQGPYVFDSLAADDQSADPATADVIANPYESSISFTRNMFAFPTLPAVFTDPHFVTRDRFGRLAGFVARQYADGVAPSGVVGVGIDESNALLVDKNGLATLVQQPSGTEDDAGTGAYILQPGGGATTCASGKPLLYKNVKVTRLANPKTDSFDFSKGCGTGAALTVTVVGSNASSPYAPSPYTGAGTATKCP